MSRLPVRLQPAWPLLKRAHRLLSFLLGMVFRRLAALLGHRGVPTSATLRSTETARLEHEAVTVHPLGTAEEIRRSRALGEPPDHWVFQRARQATVPARYVLEVRGGTVVGEFGAVVTPAHRLDYQVSGYFGIESWREHPLFLRPTLGAVDHLTGTVLSLATRGTVGNYYHFLYDAIGRYGIFEDAMGDRRLDAIVVPHQAGYQRQLLELAGIAGRLVQPRAARAVRADRLLVPSTPNQDLDAPRSVTTWLRKRLPPSGRRGDLPKRLYLTRGAAPNTRRYVQEPELVPHLERRGFTVVDPGRLSVQEQIDLFHGAEVVVGPHGAALTNLTFCQPGVRVLEMFAGTYVHLGLWTICEAIGGVDYRYLVADGASRHGRAMTGVLDDVALPVERVLRSVDELLS